MSGPAAIADAIKNMGALTSLNLASNDIGGYEDEEGCFIATPEGITTLYCAFPTYDTVSLIAIDIRSCCYR
jgi:hypothetical protein